MDPVSHSGSGHGWARGGGPSATVSVPLTLIDGCFGRMIIPRLISETSDALSHEDAAAPVFAAARGWFIILHRGINQYLKQHSGESCSCSGSSISS
jgi:hypothetical protein